MPVNGLLSLVTFVSSSKEATAPRAATFLYSLREAVVLSFEVTSKSTLPSLLMSANDMMSLHASATLAKGFVLVLVESWR